MFPEKAHHRPPFTWRDYTSLLEQPEKIKSLVTNNPLFVVHPGYANHVSSELNSINPFQNLSYPQYLQNTRDKIHQAVRNQRPTFIFTPSRFLNQTLHTLHYPSQAILLPTLENGIELDPSLLKLNNDSFYCLLSDLGITQLELIGEFSNHCYQQIHQKISSHNIQINPDLTCIY